MSESPAAEQSEGVSRRSVVLVTGMSGTGKSTALAELRHRGHGVIDTTIPVGSSRPTPRAGLSQHVDLEQITALIDGHHTGWLFIAGCVANQGMVYDRFDAVVLLSAPVEVILDRIATRVNPFGSTAENRTKIANDLMAFEPVLRAGADRRILTTAAVPKSSRRSNTSRALPLRRPASVAARASDLTRQESQFARDFATRRRSRRSSGFRRGLPR